MLQPLLHLKFATAASTKHAHAQTAFSPSPCTTLHLQGMSSKAQNAAKFTFQPKDKEKCTANANLSSKGKSMATVKTLKDDLVERGREIQDIETRLRLQVPRLALAKASDYSTTATLNGSMKKRGHQLQPSAPPPLTARDERLHRVPGKPSSTAGSYLPQAARKYREQDNQEESTKTGREASEGAKVEQLKGQLKTLPAGAPRGPKLPTHKSSASHYHTADYSPKTVASPDPALLKGPKPFALPKKLPLRHIEKCHSLLLDSQSSRPLPLVAQLARLKRRLDHVLTNVPACIDQLNAQMQRLSQLVVPNPKT